MAKLLGGTTVYGLLSATGVIYSSGGNSNQWNSTRTTTNTNSASWTSVYNSFNTNSAKYDSVYNSFNTNSAKYDSVYNTTNTNSARWSNWSSVSSLYALGTQYVKLSGDTMVGGLSAPALSTQNIFGNGTETIFSDGLIVTGNGNRTLTLNYANGIYTPNIIYTSNSNSNMWGSNWTTTNTNSASWTSVYNSFNANSASYATGGFVYGKFLPLSGGSITGNLVVQGSLTALGTATFANTIFTTTSALSVINTGPGPALYVFQAAGTSDVASFYDGDGVEVLHVGNANPGGNGFVGINESFPAVELSVRGAISASKTITVSGGNSNQWNSNWTTTNTNSASWTSVYNSFFTNSANYAIQNQNASFSTLTITNSATIVNNLSVGGTIFSSNTAYAIQYFSASIGNGVNSSFNVTHNFNTRDVIVSVRDSITNEVSFPLIVITDTNTVNVAFTFVPTSNAYTVVVIAANTSNRIAAYGNVITAIEKYTFYSSNFNLVTAGYYAIDTRTNVVRATLPLSPNPGDTILFIDPFKTWSTNYFVLNNNGNNIESLNESLTANILVDFKVTYVGSTIGWRIY